MYECKSMNEATNGCVNELQNEMEECVYAFKTMNEVTNGCVNELQNEMEK